MITLAQHLRKYPDCTEQTCPHNKRYDMIVIFQEPDRGYIATVTAFDLDGAKAVARAGVKRDNPSLHIKRLEVKASHD